MCFFFEMSNVCILSNIFSDGLKPPSIFTVMFYVPVHRKDVK